MLFLAFQLYNISCFLFLGLAVTPEGHVITLSESSRPLPELCQFDHRTGSLVGAYPYRCVPREEFAHSKLRFMDTYGDRVVIADLGTAKIQA